MPAPWPGSYLDLLAKQSETTAESVAASAPSVASPLGKPGSLNSDDLPRIILENIEHVLDEILTEVVGVRTDQKDTKKEEKAGRATDQQEGRPVGRRRQGLLARLGRGITEPTRKMAGIGRAIGRFAGGRIGKKHSWATGHNTGKPGMIRGSAIGGAAGAGVLGGVTAVASGAIIAAAALKLFHDAVNRATESQVAHARKLAEVSGEMAAVMVNRDIQELRRNIRMGGAQAGGMKELADAEQRRKDAAEPLLNAVENGSNRVLAALNDTLVPLLSVANSILEGLKEAPFGIGRAIKKLLDDGKGGEGTELDKAMADITREVGRVHEQGQKMLDIARNAARGGMGRVIPGGMPRP